MIIGRNAVMEALKSGREIDKLMALTGGEGSMKKITAMAKDMKIPVFYRDKKSLDRIAGGENHQGLVAFGAAHSYSTIEDMVNIAKSRGEDPLIVLLDGLEDPHNLGAIMRSAECVGAHGVVITKHHGVGLTETVAKASAGAIEYVACAKVTNMVQTIEKLKKLGFWIAACDMGGTSYTKADLKGPLAIVVGGEGKGVGRAVAKACDFVVSIPMKGKINSLNASNAAAVLMYEVRRQRDGELL